MGNIAPFPAGALRLPLGDVGDSLANSFINGSHYSQVKHLKSLKLLVKKRRRNPVGDKIQNSHQQHSSINLHSLNSNKISRKCSSRNLTGPQCHLVNFVSNASASYSPPSPLMIFFLTLMLCMV